MNSIQIQRDAYLKASIEFFDLASEYAESGDLNSAAIVILKALDQERRANSVGPQVLKLIKPPI